MIPRPYRFGLAVPLVFIPLLTVLVMAVFQWLKHLFWPHMTIWNSHFHTIVFITAVVTVGGFLVCRYLEARSLLASIVESSEDAIVGIKLDGTILSWNRGAEKIYGYTANEVVGKPSDIFLPFSRPGNVSNVLDGIKRGEFVEHYETTIYKDARRVHVDLTVSPILNAAGQIIGASTISRDVTERKEAEEALRQSEIQLARTCAFSLVMVAHVGLDGRWLKVSPRLCELLGYSEKEMLALTSADVTYHEDIEEERNHFKALTLDNIKSLDFEKRYVTKDGRLLWVYLNYSIVTDIEERPQHFLAYIRDITRRRREQEELKQANTYLENVFQSSPDAIGIVDEHGRFIKWNKIAAELYGYSFEELRGKSSFDLYADMGEMERMLEALREQGSVKLETMMKRKDGSVAPFEIAIALLRDAEGKGIGSVSVARDLSELKNALIELRASNERLSKEIAVRKLAEEEVNRYRDHLKDLVEERTAELARANAHLTCEIEERKRAEEALQENSERLKLFAYSVAHDLKSPAIGIHGLTQRLYSQYHHTFDEKAKLYSNQILRLSEHVAALVEQVNVFIATKESSLAIEHLELKSILRTIRDEFSARLSIRQIDWLEPECAVDFWADRLSILRVFRNLIDNALKYGGDQLSKIWMGYEDSEDFHIFEVGNDGAQLNEMDSEKIFDPFQRRGSSRGTEGSGLGLTIVKEIAERHGGTVWVTLGCEREITFHLSISKDLSCSCP
jgi:PAS domain S-box-containing protein